MKYKVNGRDVDLGSKDFLASGGQGSVYVKGDIAYKIYHDKKDMIPHGKFDELSVLSESYILRPLDLIYKNNKPEGYTMRYVKDAFSLCQTFTKAFRLRNNLESSTVVDLVKKFQSGVSYVHKNNILIVDVNEFNFIVDKKFQELYFLDVDNYQTKNYPALALMESVRDRHNKTFNEATDWFSFAVISFQMFVGIHPYKGTCDTPIQDRNHKMDYRMLNNISVLNSKVRVPSATLPFDVIPAQYLQWYKETFENGKREAPPIIGNVQINVPYYTTDSVDSVNFNIEKYYTFDSDILSMYRDFVITTNGVYKKNKKVTDRKTHVVFNGDLNKYFLVHLENNRVKCVDEYDIAVNTNIVAEKIFRVGDGLYAKNGEEIYQLTFRNVGNSYHCLPKTLNYVSPNSIQIFDGVAIESLLGRHFALIIRNGSSMKLALKYLDNAKLVNAKYQDGVLVVVYSENGDYKKAVHRVDSNFNFDERFLDVSSGDINFTVLDNGVVLHFVEDDNIELFQNKKDSPAKKLIKDDNLNSGDLLFSKGTQAYFVRGKELYKFTMK